MKQKPNIFKAIIFSIIGTIIFGIVFIFFSMIGAFIIQMMMNNKLISFLADFLYYRGDTPGLVTLTISAFIAFNAVTSVMEKINKDTKTEGLSCILIGSYIAIIQAACLIINFVCRSPFFINIAQVLVGIALISEGKDTMSIEHEVSTDKEVSP